MPSWSFLHSLIHEIAHCCYAYKEHSDTELATVFGNLLFQLAAEIAPDVPSKTTENAVPKSGTDGGIEEEAAHAHSGQTGGDAYELAHSRYQSAHHCAHSAMTVEILFCLTYLLAVKQAHVTETALCQTIDDRTAQKTGKYIVDQRQGLHPRWQRGR